LSHNAEDGRFSGVDSVKYTKCLIIICIIVGVCFPLFDITSEKANSAVRAEQNKENNEISLIEVDNVSNQPLRIGERLTYNIKVSWVPVSAGKRVDHIEKKISYQRKSVYHITSEAKTGSVASKIHRFQNRQSTFLNSVGFFPLSFRNQLVDKKYTARVEINFQDDKAEYEKISQNKPKDPEKHEKKVIEIPFGTQDELSMIYFLRCKKLEPGKKYFFPLIIKAKVVKISISVAQGEKLKIKGLGRVKTLVVTTSHGYQLWLTDDNRHIPVRIEAEAKIGKMKANLEKREFVK